jgi:3-isopropylmalate dehydratase small subunit
MSDPLILEGNCWKFGHNIPTDMITPTAYVMRGMAELRKQVLENSNPEFPQ